MTTAITRRKALTLAGQGAAAAAVATSTNALAADMSPVLDLIEKHRAAHGAFIAAIDREQELESAYFEANPNEIMVPLSMGGALSLCVQFDLDHYVDDCRKAIIARYDAERRTLHNLRHIAPEIAEQADSLLKAKQSADLKNFSRIVRTEKKQREAFGYAPALRDRDAASEGEMDAAEALLSHPCRTAAEGQARADYINSRAKAGGGIIGDSLCTGDERLINALLLSTANTTGG